MDDLEALPRLRTAIEKLIDLAPPEALAGAHYCLGVAFSYQDRPIEAYRCYIRAWSVSRLLLPRSASKKTAAVQSRATNAPWVPTLSEAERTLLSDHLKYWANIVNEFLAHGHTRRAEFAIGALLKRYGAFELKGANGSLYTLMGKLAEYSGDLTSAMERYQQAHAGYMRDRNWYSSIYIFYAYARVHRRLRNFSEAYWHLDLAAKATGDDFTNLKRELDQERARLQEDAIDLLIDSRSLLISTREQNRLSLGKQYVLLGILEALSDAHNRAEESADHGLSKSEIIERVWKEKYRPEAHDNKLYYNINRLRKLIEPDMRHPKYLLNWKEGYRLAPGIKVHYIKS